MNRQESKELLPIIIAHAEGKKIEVKDKRLSDNWYNWCETDDPSFNIKQYDYRIKPEPKYRPFSNAEECWTEMQKHHPFGWVKQINDNEPEVYIYCGAITKVDGVITSIDEVPFSYENVYNTYKFADGTPFGVKEQKIK